MMKERTAVELAATQGGVIHRRQALELGFTADQIRTRCESGAWSRVGKHGLRLFGAPTGVERARAAVAVLPNAVVSHETAAEIHDIGRLWRGLAVVSVHSRTTHRFPDVTVRRNHDLQDSDVAEVDRMPVTTIGRTVVDMARFLTEAHLCDVIDDLMATGRLTSPDLGSVIEVVARRGRPGSAMLRRIREEYVTGVPVPPSVLERRGRQLLSNAGLAPPEQEFPIPWSRSRRFDDAYPRQRIAIEWDSRRWHMRQDAFDSDRQRDNEASIHGWAVYRFTWRDVTSRPWYVRDMVERALAARSAGSGRPLSPSSTLGTDHPHHVE